MRTAVALCCLLAVVALTPALAWQGYDHLLVGTVQDVDESTSVFRVTDDHGTTWRVRWTEQTRFLTTPRPGLRLKIAYEVADEAGGAVVALRVGLARKDSTAR